MSTPVTISGRLVRIATKTIEPSTVVVEDGRIASVTPYTGADADSLPYLLPGFVDAHVHVESSMLVPSEFARLAVVHGTVGTISDPHEIGNVCGVAGVDYMIHNGSKVPFKFYFGAPSCVPATGFETAGAVIGVEDIDHLLQRKEIVYLTEMMNFPGVLHADPVVMQKIALAKKHGKVIDGHAPGLRGVAAKQYIDAGISTDHECFTKEEALDKLHYGMKILIREGSAARNFEALIELLHDHEDAIMFCSDDKHPDSLVEGHINVLCARAVAKGIDVFKVLKAACLNPVHHYGMKVGQLQAADPADFILVKDLVHFEVLQTWIDGQQVAANGKTLITAPKAGLINQFSCTPKAVNDFAVPLKGETTIPVIEALDGQLITNKLLLPAKVSHAHIVSDPENDVLKIAVVNRYKEAPVATAFIKNFGLKRGAIASSVAHDSHNIVAVGADDESLARAVNAVIAAGGGVSCIDGAEEYVLPLPVAGLMSTEDGYVVAEKYAAIDKAAKALGSPLGAPFMTLSFMALLVIPHLKLSDLGLFDGDTFSFVP
ncbi:adenine deaminase [Flaviaesturariibacter aridisoli]|uniref:Adenine deaminase n=1 Tax=Flaviaesturariibacter aridisoli TaxID=2545761 RepID=A0A4R4E5N7_9BACT|nr:adenine deaminase [Flaviaesturariibacter aridisoli]TCZ74964.1 adenine deaminase [Flaviaesturariibacter aridisoli]